MTSAPASSASSAATTKASPASSPTLDDDAERQARASCSSSSDGGGQPIAFGRNRIDPGTPGSDVRLTIDRYMQRLIETELDYQVKLHQASGGSIIVMDPKTGAIIAMACAPASSSPSCRWRHPDLSLLRERAVTDLYEPGSVMKTITMAAAIDLGLVTPNTTYFDSGSVMQGRLRVQELGLRRQRDADDDAGPAEEP